MAKGYEVLEMLIPQGGWVITGDEFEGITFIDCDKITKAKFDAGFAQFDAFKAAKVAEQADAKSSILDRLGITADEAKLLLA
jgi:hypothetical protein